VEHDVGAGEHEEAAQVVGGEDRVGGGHERRRGATRGSVLSSRFRPRLLTSRPSGWHSQGWQNQGGPL
jgi:hypothetical protein